MHCTVVPFTVFCPVDSLQCTEVETANFLSGQLLHWLISPCVCSPCTKWKTGKSHHWCNHHYYGLRTPTEEIAFRAQPKIQSQSQLFWYGRRMFCLPHRPNFSDIFDLCLHWASVLRVINQL